MQRRARQQPKSAPIAALAATLAVLLNLARHTYPTVNGPQPLLLRAFTGFLTVDVATSVALQSALVFLVVFTMLWFLLAVVDV